MYLEEEDPDFGFGDSAPSALGRARRSPTDAQWAQPPKGGEDDGVQDPSQKDLETYALASLDDRDTRQREALKRELAEFIEQMRARGLPGVTRITIRDGYKKGWRYLFTPKYCKENLIVVAGWKLHVREIEELRNDPQWHDLLDVQVFAVTAGGDLLDKYIWLPYGGSGLEKIDVQQLSGKYLSNQRWYLQRLREKLLAQ